MPRYKVFVPPLPAKIRVGEVKSILLAGIEAHPETELCAKEDEADLILLDFRHLARDLYKIEHPEKTILTDYRDPPQLAFSDPALLYFKRSVVDPRSGDFVKLEREYLPIAYCLRSEFLALKPDVNGSRKIDIAVFFNPCDGHEKPRNRFRPEIAQYVRRNFRHKNLFVGIAGKAGEPGRSELQSQYADIMLRSKIIVTCNPDRWEGDYRLFEALGSGAAVLSDQMITPVLNPFINEKHLIYYDRANLDTLGAALARLLYDDKLRLRISKNGFRHCLKYHTPENRIDQILNEFLSVTKG